MTKEVVAVTSTKQGYKRVFLDTCILSEIGRMKKSDRGDLLYRFIVEAKYQLVMTPFQVLELTDIPDKQWMDNIFDFLNGAYVGMTKNIDDVVSAEIAMYHTHGFVDAVAFPLSLAQKARDGKSMNFRAFLDTLLHNPLFIRSSKDHADGIAAIQQKKWPPVNTDTLFSTIIFNKIYKLDPDFLKSLDGEMIDYNRIPSFVTWAYCYAHKVYSSGLQRKAKEMNDVAMLYIAPYMDIVVTDRKQAASYEEI